MTTATPKPMTSTLYKPHPTDRMKAAQWMGTRTIQLGTVAKPTITDPSDAIIHITHCTIGGADLHLYDGELSDLLSKGDILGHEAIGTVEEVGAEVRTISPGDRVMILPVIACGHCEFCKRREFSLCDTTNPSREMESAYGHRVAGMLGFTRLYGGYPGAQAEYVRVPNADLCCVRAPADMDAKKLLGLAHVTTAAWHGCELVDVQPGDIVGVWGCGPVGLSVQRLAVIRGAKKVYAIDKDAGRLQIAEEFGMIPVDVSVHAEVGDYILSMEPQGLDCTVEASGFRSTQKPQHAAMRAIGLEHDSSDTVSAMIKATRKGGHLALLGDFFYKTNDFPIGPLMEKGLTIRGGQVNSQKYHPLLLDLVTQGKYDPSWVFTYEDDFENIVEDYRRFSRHEIPGGLKVCLVTEYGRGQACSDASEAIQDR